MSAKAMPATVYVANSRHLSEVKLCARASRIFEDPGLFCKVWTADGGRRTVKKTYKKK